MYFDAEKTGLELQLKLISLQQALNDAKQGDTLEVDWLTVSEGESLAIPAGVKVVADSVRINDSAKLAVNGELTADTTYIMGSVELNGILTSLYINQKGSGKVTFGSGGKVYLSGTWDANWESSDLSVLETQVIGVIKEDDTDPVIFPYWNINGDDETVYYWNGAKWILSGTDPGDPDKPSVAGKTFTIESKTYDFTGEAITPAVTSTEGLSEGTDYTVSYINNVLPGQATVLITGIGNYTGEQRLNFTILKGTAVLTASMTGDVTLEEGVYTAVYGSKPKITASLSHNYGTAVVEGGLTYTSSNEEVAVVSDTGVVTLKKAADEPVSITVAMTATDTLEAQSTVALKLKVTKAPQKISVPENEYIRYLADGKFSLRAEAPAQITYVSSDTQEEILSVDADGYVTPIKTGQAEITLKAGADDCYEAAEDVKVSVRILAGDSEVKLKQKKWAVGYGDNSGDNTLDLSDTSELLKVTGGKLLVSGADGETLSYDIDSRLLKGLKGGELNLTLQADADEGNGYGKSPEVTVPVKIMDAVAKVGESDDSRTYISVSSALSAIEKSGLITLIKDTEDTGILHLPSDRAVIQKGMDVILNYAGHQYNGTLRVFGKLTLRNTTSPVLTGAGTEGDISLSAQEEGGSSFQLLDQGQLIVEQSSGSSSEIKDDAIKGDTAKLETVSGSTTTVTYFASLSQAVGEANTQAEGGTGSNITVELTNPAVLDNDVELKENVTLNLAGNPIAAKSDQTIGGSGKVTSEVEAAGGATEKKNVVLSEGLLATGAGLQVEDGTVTETTVLEYTVGDQDKHTYDGAVPELVLTQKDQDKDYSKYKVEPVEEGETGVGTHTYKANVYLDGTFVKQYSGEIEVVPKTVAAKAAAVGKTYDGTAKAEVTVEVTDPEVKTLLENDGVEIVSRGSFEGSEPGDNKKVNVTASLELNGEEAANYVLQLDSAEVTASITKADMTVTANDVEHVYDGNSVEPDITISAGQSTVSVMYAEGKSGNAPADSDYKSEKPAFDKVGTYTVYYKATAANYNDAAGNVKVTVTVPPAVQNVIDKLNVVTVPTSLEDTGAISKMTEARAAYDTLQANNDLNEAQKNLIKNDYDDLLGKLTAAESKNKELEEEAARKKAADEEAARKAAEEAAAKRAAEEAAAKKAAEEAAAKKAAEEAAAKKAAEEAAAKKAAEEAAAKKAAEEEAARKAAEEEEAKKEKNAISTTPGSLKAKAQKKGKVKLTWKALKKTKKTKKLYSQVKKIEIQYSTDSTFNESATKTKKVSKTKATITLSGLKKKAVYYFRIRYVDKTGGCSKWTKAKKVKTK